MGVESIEIDNVNVRMVARTLPGSSSKSAGSCVVHADRATGAQA